MENEWKYAKNLKEMPNKWGRYLFMTELGTFFVGVWSPHERKLYVQCAKFEEDDIQIRKTTGAIYMVQWDFKRSGHVYWAKPGVIMDFYRIWQRCRKDKSL